MTDIFTISFIVVCVVSLIVGKHEKNKEERYWKSRGRKKVKIGDKWYWV